MADGRHYENRYIAISQWKTDFHKILYTAADFELGQRHVIKNEKVALDRLRVRQNEFLVTTISIWSRFWSQSYNTTKIWILSLVLLLLLICTNWTEKDRDYQNHVIGCRLKSTFTTGSGRIFISCTSSSSRLHNITITHSHFISITNK